ncbi:ABC transporter ATP-binding protein [Singulisphaera acidiphila]|uniref:ABC-type antimicrobial peptide transport system, ATPase component n=1 Tax=Singulisphaera acidiphila (strain ATCC BAA-1392 / DSM 18658 / VKM B-2454 / MOB10) TaxID=886293 RepID=L0DE50_SINAD|nr:ABC transporter ATP-binding protein [Singulisphaera acidiphila]AGA27659.1 ABC-type antimicrobial peptide transport system, ATPase component [Singulisphaera acidiphila DSM 18658]
MSSPVSEPVDAFLAVDLVVQAEGVTKTYVEGDSTVAALRGIDLVIGRGERVALLGKSGSGKSTLLNLLGGLDRPTSGTVRIAGSNLHAMNADEMARFRLETVGMIFQAYNLVDSRTTLENVELPMVFAGRAKHERRAAARAALEAVGLGDRLNHRPNQLSGGERQRVAIARALVNRPAVLLADEPTGNLDTATAHEILRLLLDHLEQHNTTLILVTHDEELARRSTDRVVRLRDGRILAGVEE